SFPIRPTKDYDALVHTDRQKGYKIQDLKGTRIGSLLREKLAERFAGQSYQVTVVNDMEAILLAGLTEKTDAAIIVGTGFNSGFIGKDNRLVTTESGGEWILPKIDSAISAMEQDFPDYNPLAFQTRVSGKHLPAVYNYYISELGREKKVKSSKEI